MHFQTVGFFIVTSVLFYFQVFAQLVPPDCNGPNPCINAHLFCPGIVIICKGPNQEIRPTGPCNCCNGCFNISQVGGPCGTSAPQFKCAKGLVCVHDVCENCERQ